ncbi:hypothetical protein QJQ45_029028 [Haematococcus lacustris]|nr:hypothetical protein QJQ45_029028 [Haematococcus lacustris]
MNSRVTASASAERSGESDMVSAQDIEAVAYINGKRWVLPPGRGETTLLAFLRGLCNAVLCPRGHRSDRNEVGMRRACCPAPAGIGNTREGLHPVQERLAKAHGSQCGFCTPGFVMSMYSLLRSSSQAPSEEQIEDALGGNLCRCTGYRPILDAFRVFAKSDPKAYTEEAIAAAKGLMPAHADTGSHAATNGHSDANGHTACNGATGNGASKGASNGSSTASAGGRVCPSSGLPCDCGAKVSNGSTAGGCEAKGGCGGGGCGACGGSGYVGRSGKSVAEPIFPPELKARAPQYLVMPGPQVTWHRPVTLEQLLELKATHPAAKLVVGNTEVGIEMKFKDMKYPILIAPTHVPELNSLAVTEQGVTAGAGVTLTRLMTFLKAEIAARPAWQTSTFQAVVGQLRWFAGNQIRNVSALAGNIVTGSPISDLNPLWMASGTTFTALGKDSAPRTVPASQFFLGYRQVDLRPHEILYQVHIPFTRPYEFVKEFKQSPRREDDIAIVNAGMRVRLEQAASGGWIVAEAAVAYGGVAARAIMAPQVAAALVGRPWDEATLTGALEAVRNDVVISDSAPGGKVEYRRALAASFIFKFFAHVATLMDQDSQTSFKPDLPDGLRSAAKVYDRPHAHGVQFHADALPNDVVGQPYQHMAADLQVCGEATYTDDIKLSSDALWAIPVTSTRAHAKILKVDASQALQAPGVAGYFGHKDVPGSNMIGPVVADEEVFASEVVTAVGQIIGLVVADSESAARRAARLVVVEYQDLPAVMSCEEAVEAGAFYSYANRLECGDVDAALSAAEHTLEGTFKLSGQEHFYLETNNCCVIPLENDEFTIYSSTQVRSKGQQVESGDSRQALWQQHSQQVGPKAAPAKHQKYVAHVLGVPAHKVVSKTKRLGGGFGGKETRSIFLHCAVAVPAHALRRPVKLSLDRDEDMQMTGQRHAFMCQYKVGHTSEGRITALDYKLYNNAGNSWDLSAAIMDRCLLHCDNVYKVDNMRVAGRLCRTNQASNTAFRGFGGPQGLMFAEMTVEQVARAVGRPVHEVRELNMYQEGDVTHFKQVLEVFRAPTCWKEVKASSQYEERMKQARVEAFNAEHRWRKRGLAITPTKFGISFTTKFMNQAGALVHVYLDDSVLVSHGGVEMGQGLHTKMAQVAAQALGLPLHKVFISETSTDKVPNASPTAASASSDMYGGAVLDACRQIKERLLPYRERFPDRSFKEIVNAAYLDRVDLSAHGFYATPDITGFGGVRPFNYFAYGAAVAEVELDTLTGDWHVLRADVVMDVGNPLNPAIDIGQVEGGFVQGMGWLCMEELQWGDRQHPWVRPGHLFTKGPGTYKIPTANDIPVDFRVALLRDAPNTRAIHSSKAVGEPPFHLGACVFFALKEAVYAARKDAGHAGYFVLDTPATPERLRMLCADPIATTYVAPDFRPKISC